MAKKTRQQKVALSMAGEFGTASELYKRGYMASVTYGNAKATDIVILSNSNGKHSFKRVEVKTSDSTRFVTNFFQKYGDPSTLHPDYWIFVHIDKNSISHYYILSHEEVGEIQMVRNNMTVWAPLPKGCDNILLSAIKDYENKWEKINL